MCCFIPKKLKKGDEIRVIAPATSLKVVSSQQREIAKQRFDDLGLKLSFGKNVEEFDEFMSSSVESRVDDLHEAFSDDNVKAILTVLGGFNSNQLLSYIDWSIIKNNPKIFCGFSDVTILCNSIYAKTGIITYYGPHYSTFGQKKYFDYTLDYFKKCLMSDKDFEILPSGSWTDDFWYIDQEDRNPISNEGFVVVNPGLCEGTLLGGNLCTFNLLQGTDFFPKIRDSVIFLEDDDLTGDSSLGTFDRDLQSIIHQNDFKCVKGIVIGRFQRKSKVEINALKKIIKNKKELKNIPVIYGLDFGHTSPILTLPIGGKVEIDSKGGITIKEH